MNEPPTDIALSKSEVRENEDRALVGNIEITDPDVKQRYNCTILDVDTQFYIDSSANQPTLRTNYSFDFEISRVEYVNIKCEDIVLDHRQAQHSIEKRFKIDVIGMEGNFDH